MRVVVVVLGLLLAACGSNAEEPAPKSSTSASPKPSPSATTTAKPTPATPSGNAVPEALSRFRCEPNAKGVWNASGYVANPGKNKMSFQVTVHIGAAGGSTGRARTHQVAQVAAGGSVRFVVPRIPAPKDGGTCRVQILAVSGG